MSVTTKTDAVFLPTGGSKRPKATIPVILFVLPSILMLALLLVLPIGQAFLRTFQSDAGWGIDNYTRAFRQDHLARLAMRHTFIFAALSVAGQYFIGFAVALLLNQKLPLRGMFRVLFLLPWMFPAVVPGIVWRWMFDGLFGVFNEILYRIGYYGPRRSADRLAGANEHGAVCHGRGEYLARLPVHHGAAAGRAAGDQ